MSGAPRLDNRACLYGEARLSDAQVIALRACAVGTIYRDRTSYKSGKTVIHLRTIDSLARILAVKIGRGGCCGDATITPSGKSLLAKIDAEAAHG